MDQTFIGNTYFDDIGMFVSTGAVDALRQAWNEPHRFYHDETHLNKILSLIDKSQIGGDGKHMLKLAAYFHDAVYDPRRTDNEDRSIEMFHRYAACPDSWKTTVVTMIEGTKDHTKDRSGEPLVQTFIDMDIHELLHGSISDMISNGELIFKEFQFYDFLLFKQGRTVFLNKYVPYIMRRNPQSQILSYQDYFNKSFNPNIAVYPGSFLCTRDILTY